MEPTYCIRNEYYEYWSNEYGWLIVKNNEETMYDIFTKEEKETLSLPTGICNGVRWEII